MFSLISALINCLVNNGEAGDLRRHRAHYDITLMSSAHSVTARGTRGYLLLKSPTPPVVPPFHRRHL